MAKIDLTKHIQNHEDFVGSLLLGTMTNVVEAARTEGKESDIIKVFNITKEDDRLVADVKVTVNGVEVPFLDWAHACEKRLHHMVTARAQVLLGERMRDFNEKLYNLEKNIEKESRVLFPDFGIDEWNR